MSYQFNSITVRITTHNWRTNGYIIPSYLYIRFRWYTSQINEIYCTVNQPRKHRCYHCCHWFIGKTKGTTMTIILYVDIVSQHHWYSINTSGLLTTILHCCSIRNTNNYHFLLLLLVLLLIRWYHLKEHHNNNLYRLKSISAYLTNDVLALVISTVVEVILYDWNTQNNISYCMIVWCGVKSHWL